MTILVTGANGMIGSQVIEGLLDAGYKVIGIDILGDNYQKDNYCYYNINLEDKAGLKKVVESNNIDRFVHLAALAHTGGETDLSWKRYKKINVDCSRNLFELAGERPVLYISTVDVYGFYDGKIPVNGKTKIDPVSYYGKSKALAEIECKKLKHYTIFRFSPVYTDTIMRDIQKRYYLKYPLIAYQVGRGSEYEILNVKNAVASIVDWCDKVPRNDIRIIKDDKLLWTPEYIRTEKEAGRAKVVLRFPFYLVKVSYLILKKILGKNEKTYLLNKVVYPLRSEN